MMGQNAQFNWYNHSSLWYRVPDSLCMCKESGPLDYKYNNTGPEDVIVWLIFCW